MPRGRAFGLIAAAFCIFTSGCEDKNGLRSLTGPTPTLEPTFSTIRAQIFESGDSSGRPSCVSCHTSQGRTPPAGLDLVNAPYEALVNRASVERPGLQRVAPGDPDNSYLIHKLEGRAGIVGQRMPLRGPFLTDGQVQIVRRWVQLGAQNN